VRIVVLAVGFRGNVHPSVALVARLEARGFRVTIACPGVYREMAEAAGLPCVPLSGDPRAELATKQGQRALGAGRNAFRFARRLAVLGRPMLARYLAEQTAACSQADAIVFSPMGFVGYHVAEQRGVPSVLAQLQPTEPTRAFPSFTVPGGRSLGPLGNRLSHLAAEQALWQVLRPAVNRWPREALDLAPLPLAGPYPRLRRQRHPTLYAYSPTVLPRPPDWPDHIQVTGYWFLDPQPGWRPPPALTAFLAAGPPPVYVGFGSMVSGDPAATRQLVRVALRCAGVRGVLLGDPAADPSDEHVHVVADSPHTWLLPHTAAVVHHGGAGTTGAGLRAGVPNVICPWFADQPLWAERVHALGAGPRPVPPDASPPWRWATPSPRLSATPPCVRKPPRSAARSRPSAA
jgi:UDP:flavonoid glycosyltransferase YjiC (YdhE family)